jgi:arylsulfatase A-like enzyme
MRMLATLATLLLAVPAQEARRPNVLFIAVDDLNDWIEPLGGHPQTKTPALARLAKRSMTFTRAYCSAPACNPSRASLLSGIRPSTSGVYHNSQPWRPAMKDAVVLPQFFAANGYRVAGGGKIFHGGFEEPASWPEYFKEKGGGKGGAKIIDPEKSRAGGIVWGVLDGTDEQISDHRMVTWAAEFLKAPQEKPFFLAAGLHKPHMPWQVPKKYYDLFPLDSIQLPEVPSDDLVDIPKAGLKVARPEGDHAKILETGRWKNAVQGYLAAIAYADAEISRILDALDAGPHKENTIVVLWGDHGWHLGEKQHWRKFALWERAARVPLFIAVPGLTAPGSVCGRTVDLMSLYPTLAELCGLPAPARQEGVSIKPLLADPKAAWERPALTTHGRDNHALRSERYRYIRYADGSEELYDHDADPNEWKNLAADPAHADAKKKLAEWLPKTNAPDAPAAPGQKD